MDRTTNDAWRALGLSVADREAYLAVLGGATDESAVAGRTGHPRDRVERSLEALRSRGLINSGADGGVVAGKPLLTLRRAAAQLQGLAGDLLAESADLQLVHDSVNVPDQGRPDVQVLTEVSDVQRAFADLLAGAEHEVLACVKPPFLANGDFTEDEAAHLGRGVQFRVIYDPSAIELMGGPEELAGFVRAGEQARVTDAIPLKMFVVDRRRALLLSIDGAEDGMTPGDDSPPAEGDAPGRGSAILVSGRGMVAALAALFESVWTRAWDLTDPPPPDGLVVDRRDRSIIAALRLGATDDTIARRLGVTGRTVGRRISRLHQLTGTQTRFQLGWRLAQLTAIDSDADESDGAAADGADSG